MHVAVAPAFSGNGQGHFKSKKALKEAIAAGENVLFRDTSIFSPLHLRASDLAQGQTIYIVGPSEYERKWFAQVRSLNGRVVVA